MVSLLFSFETAQLGGTFAAAAYGGLPRYVVPRLLPRDGYHSSPLYISTTTPAAAAGWRALGSPNLTALVTLNEQISTKFKINKEQINLSSRASKKHIYSGVRPI